jgi:hypothetical protein
MNTAKAQLRHKHYRLNAKKIARAQRVLHAGTETETIELALDHVLSEHRRNRLAWEAAERFLKSGVEVQDAYGKLKE